MNTQVKTIPLSEIERKIDSFLENGVNNILLFDELNEKEIQNGEIFLIFETPILAEFKVSREDLEKLESEIASYENVESVSGNGEGVVAYELIIGKTAELKELLVIQIDYNELEVTLWGKLLVKA